MFQHLLKFLVWFGKLAPRKGARQATLDALIFDIFGRHRLGANVFLTLAAKYASEYVRIQFSTCINKTTYYPNLPKYLAWGGGWRGII